MKRIFSEGVDESGENDDKSLNEITVADDSENMKAYRQEQIFSWKENSVGFMDRGFGIGYKDFEYDVPVENEAYTYWGSLLITSVILKKALQFFKHHPTRFSIIDNINDTTLVVKMITNNDMMLCRGNKPCILSSTETIKPKYGEWFHFDYDLHAYWMRENAEIIWDKMPEANLFLVVNLVPLKLIEFEKIK